MKDNINVFINREISHLEFHKRVLLQATDDSIPLFERLNFLKIFYNNIDEFFMTRVSALYKNKTFGKKKSDNLTNLSVKQQIVRVCKKTNRLLKLADKVFYGLKKEVSKQYFEHIDFDKLNHHQLKFLENFFNNNILPLISPQIIDKHHPFPFLINNKVYIFVKLVSKKKDSVKIGVIPTFGYFNRLIFLPNDHKKTNSKLYFILVEELILFFLNKLFNKYKVISKTCFKITTNTEMNFDDKIISQCNDMKQAMAILLKARRFLSPVKLFISKCNDVNFISSYLRHNLSLEQQQIFIIKAPLDLSYLSSLIKNFDLYDYPQLFYPEITHKKPDDISKISMINEVMAHDILLSFPFESMAVFSKLLDQAAQDPDVVSIKMTLYRVACNSQIVSILKKAADNGKDVLVIVELKARFDEQNNIDWATSLSESGCKVIYGLEHYKVHAKILLITRKENDKIHYISQIGTGNYNEITAKTYTDLSLMTSDEAIGKDILNLFNNICVGTLQETSIKILSSPFIFKSAFLNLISDEIQKALLGQPAQIIIKCNALSDKDIILKLIEASQAGVNITLIVRGICCLLPGVYGYTDNIKVISIIGRFLEHSRIFIFGAENKKVFISSADLMPRNTSHRIEVTCPIEDDNIKSRILDIIDVYLNDNVLASKLCYNGLYQKLSPNSFIQTCNSHEKLFYL